MCTVYLIIAVKLSLQSLRYFNVNSKNYALKFHGNFHLVVISFEKKCSQKKKKLLKKYNTSLKNILKIRPGIFLKI